ncbi:MAG TPA: phosphoenolpyruvate hydrolase family protein [Planctomycetota bacterium]
MQGDTLLRALASDEPLVGAAVGSGMTAAAAEEGGADFVMVLSAGFFRLQGASSASSLLPHADANALTWEIAARHVLTRLARTPAILGVCAQDPELDVDALLDRAAAHGVAGLTNFPSVAFYDGAFRAALEAAGFGYARELDLLRRAKARGFATVAFCLTPADAAAAAEAGIDVLCLNLGLAETRSLDPEEHQAALDQAILAIQAMMAVAKGVPCVIFGGPVLLPQDTQQVYQRTEARGYVGGSAVERFPAAPAVTQAVRDFKHAARAGRSMDRLGSLIGTGPAMKRVFETIRAVAPSDATVLITGESGTGKELAARELHRLSHLAGKPLVGWNCAATAETLAMSELFGHEKGAFTGAVRAHVGQFELADGGTLFMDEVADLSPAVQAALLRVLQERRVTRVGGERTIAVDVRLIAATNQDFRQLVQAGRFRLDLYYRLSVVVLRMPPLRERTEDIPFLVWELAREFAQKYGCPPPRFPDAVMSALLRHAWPGNVRELRNLVERLVLLTRGEAALSRARFDAIFETFGDAPPAGSSLPLAERRAKLRETLDRLRGNKTAAARALGVTRKTIHKWLRC